MRLGQDFDETCRSLPKWCKVLQFLHFWDTWWVNPLVGWTGSKPSFRRVCHRGESGECMHTVLLADFKTTSSHPDSAISMVFYNRSPHCCSNLQAISKKPTSLSTFWGNAGRVAAWQAISTAPAWCWAAFVALVAAGQAGVCSGWTSNDFSEEKLLVHVHAVGYVRLRVCWTLLSRWQRVWSVLCAVDVVYLIVAPSLAALNDVGFMVPGNLWTVPTFGPCRHFKHDLHLRFGHCRRPS